MKIESVDADRDDGFFDDKQVVHALGEREWRHGIRGVEEDVYMVWESFFIIHYSFEKGESQLLMRSVGYRWYVKQIDLDITVYSI